MGAPRLRLSDLAEDEMVREIQPHGQEKQESEDIDIDAPAGRELLSEAELLRQFEDVVRSPAQLLRSFHMT